MAAFLFSLGLAHGTSFSVGNGIMRERHLSLSVYCRPTVGLLFAYCWRTVGLLACSFARSASWSAEEAQRSTICGTGLGTIFGISKPPPSPARSQSSAVNFTWRQEISSLPHHQARREKLQTTRTGKSSGSVSLTVAITQTSRAVAPRSEVAAITRQKVVSTRSPSWQPRHPARPAWST